MSTDFFIAALRPIETLGVVNDTVLVKIYTDVIRPCLLYYADVVGEFFFMGCFGFLSKISIKVLLVVFLNSFG